MYMMIRQKCSKITDEQLAAFVNGKQSRDKFLDEFDLQFHEKEQVLGIGFWIRDRLVDYLTLAPMADKEKSIRFILEMYVKAFPNSDIMDREGRLHDWQEKDKWESKMCLATGIYFLNHYKGGVRAVTTYTY